MPRWRCCRCCVVRTGATTAPASPTGWSGTSITGRCSSPCASGGDVGETAGVLIRGVDGATDDEWRSFVSTGPRFGELIAAGAGRPVPVVVPTHFVFDGDSKVWLHLARPNPVWE